ncbi:MAG: 3-methyl-2-oxobutanoate dehydrogenase subunit beta [Acidobacteriota bacterium]
MSQIKIKEFVPAEEYLASGHLACPGCGASLAMRYALKALGSKTIVVIPACCWSIIAGPYPQTSLSVPLFHTAFETAAAVASGVKAALDIRGNQDITVLAWAGDGGTFDIGIQALSGAAERNEDIIYICYDNEAYMNTGIQRSSATPWGAWTTTTPTARPKSHPKKNIMEIMAAHRIPYAASAAVAYPVDFMEKVKKSKRIRGTRFIHLLSPCPPGWKCADEESIMLTRMAVQSRIFPLYEVENGERYRLSMDHSGSPVKEYIRRQGRFRHLTDKDIDMIQERVNDEWERLLRKVKESEDPE